MRVEKVPVDMSSEQKEILGLLSKRELAYLVVGSLILYGYLPIVYKILSGAGWIVAGIGALFTALPTIGIVFFLGFIKVAKLNMNRDFYLWIRFQKRTQYGSWRKGR